MKQSKISFVFNILIFLLLSGCDFIEIFQQSNESAHEILDQSLLAMEQLKSYSIEMNTNQTITLPEEDPMNMKMIMSSDIIMNPLQFYMAQEITSQDLNTEDPMTTEVYFINGGFYMKEPITNSWVKYSGEYIENILELQKSQINPEEQLHLLKKFIKNITAKENESQYILNLQADGETLKEIIREMIGSFGENMDFFDEAFDELAVSTFDYKIYIDKTTYYQTKMDIEMEFSMTMEGKTMFIKQSMNSTISNYDAINEITIPQEVLNSAEEISLDL